MTVVMSMEEARERWYAAQDIPGVGFRLNDSAYLLSGRAAGEWVAVISLERLEPEPLYLVELASGRGDLTVPQSALAASEPGHEPRTEN